MRSWKLGSAWLLAVVLSACFEKASLPEAAGYGAHPTLPEPKRSLVPTLDIAPARGWPEGAKPLPAPGLAVAAFATGLDHPRWLFVLPNGDVLVAETNAPARPPDGIRGWLTQRVMARAGSAVTSPNRISLLRDADGDGSAELLTVFVEGIQSPFGMELVGSDFYVAATDALWRFPYRDGETRLLAPGEKVADLPGGPRT